MNDPIPVMTFTRKSEDGIRKIVSGIDHMAEDVLTTAPLAIQELTDLLEAAVIKEFKAGNHHGRDDADRAGTWAGGSWGDQHPRTLDTIQKESHGMIGRVTIGGGAPYIEFGTHEHPLSPKSKGALHWREGGEDFFSAGHEISGTKADDFAGRALEDVDAEAVVSALFSSTFLKIIKELE